MKNYFIIFPFLCTQFTIFSQDNLCVPQNLIEKPSQVLIDHGLIRDGCNQKGAAYKEGTCFWPIERILNRTVSGNSMNISIWENEWDGDHPETKNNSDNYWRSIKFFVDSKASLIHSAINLWGSNDQINPDRWENGDFNYLTAVNQLVVDINAAYDCAGLVRPFISANILEHLDDAKWEEKYMIEYVPIPSCVIEAFMNDASFDKNYYCQDLNQDGIADLPLRPKTGLMFTFDKVRFLTDPDGNPVYPGSGFFTVPDMTNTETAMWFYHNAKCYIDRGVNAFSLGQMGWMANKERNSGYPRLRHLVEKIRSYADSKGVDILITAEPYAASDGLGSKYYYIEQGIKHYFFDYQQWPLWANELSSTQFTDNLGCSNSPDQYNIFSTSECAGTSTPGVFNRCVMEKLNAFNEKGIGPNGCYYNFMPSLIYFDFGHGCEYNDANNNQQWDAGEPVIEGISPDYGHCWGYDDCNWFTTLSSECKERWFNTYLCNLQNANLLRQHVSMMMPARLLQGYLQCHPFKRYYIFNDPFFENSLLQKIDPIDPPVEYKVYCFGIYKKCLAFIDLKTLNDCTSLYTWHCKKPDGSWWQFKRDKTAMFKFDQEGTYEISLRQDNMGLIPNDPNSYGSHTKTIYYYFDKNECCEDPKILDGNLQIECGSILKSYSANINFQSTITNDIKFISLKGEIENIQVDSAIRHATLGLNYNDPNIIKDTIIAFQMVDDKISATSFSVNIPNCEPSFQQQIQQQEYINVQIFPNPSLGEFKLLSNDANIIEVCITDNQGRLIDAKKLNENISSFIIDVQSGVYFARITTNQGIIVKKLIIIK